MRIHRVYCKSLSGPNKQFDLDEPQSRHLIKGLRIKENDVVEVFDGMGDVAKCIVIKLTNKLCSVERTEDIRSDTKSNAQLKAIIPIIKKITSILCFKRCQKLAWKVFWCINQII